MLKRSFDIVVASIALILCAPALIILALAVAAELGRPVIFRQRRPGMNGKPFWILKFRTMTSHTGPDGTLLPDGDRLTRFGKFLRSTSMDELPALINVVRGDMSLVGPRPLLEQYLTLYDDHQARRHGVRPGITGLAQVKGRNALSWEEKFDYDVWYVDHRTFSLDLRILAMTSLIVIRRKGINEHEHATMAPFLGSDRSEV